MFTELNYDDNVGNHHLFENTKFYSDHKLLGDGMYYIDTILTETDKAKLSSSVMIKDGTTLISNYAFCENTNIKTMTLPSSLIYIGSQAFKNCKNLKTIIYKGSEDEFKNIKIESSAFSGTNDVEYIYE